MEITGGGIVSAVEAAIRARWQDAAIYTEKALQGMKTPCFFVYQLNAASAPAMRGRAIRDFLILIRYHATDEKSRYAGLYAMGSALMEVTKAVELEDGRPIYGGNSRFEIVDGHLSFTVSYKINTKTRVGADPMRAIEKNIYIKE